MWLGLTKVVKSLAVVRHLPLPAAGSADQRGSKRENRGAGQLVGLAKVAQLYAIFLCSLDVEIYSSKIAIGTVQTKTI